MKQNIRGIFFKQGCKMNHIFTKNYQEDENKTRSGLKER